MSDPHCQAKIIQEICVPSACVQLEFSTTYTAQNAHYEASYETVSGFHLEKWARGRGKIIVRKK